MKEFPLSFVLVYFIIVNVLGLVLFGSIGSWLGMKVWHHKTLHKKFKYGIPLIMMAQFALLLFALYKANSV